MPGSQTVAQRNLTCAIRIRERRRQLGLTQAELGDRVSEHGSRLSVQTLSAIENGRRLAVGRLPDLATALRCTVSYLLGLTADPDRWAPDDTDLPAPARAEQLTARAEPGSPPARHPEPVTTGTVTTGPVTTGTAPPRHGWILGPDLPDAVPPSPRSS